MKHLDLFSGYGGFTIPTKKYNIETVGFSEVDKYACAVLNYHYPNIKNYGDITKIKGKDLPSIDIITGGSPCQDLSVAGKGAGLNGERSGLFFHFIRLIKEKQPQYFIWENVKGALSSSRGRDFARVQIEMEQAGYDVFWQVINAKDFGVPQNRERIFAIGIRKGSGGEVLFERQSSSKNPKTREQISSTIHAGYYKQGGRDQQYVEGAKTGLYAVDITRRAKEKYKLKKNGLLGSITATYYKGIGNAERPGVLTYKGMNICNRSTGESGLYWSCDTNVKIVGNIYDSQGENGQVLDPSGISKTIKSGETNTKGNGGVGSSNSPKILEDMRIRRLTPTECERLMGLPDGWTAKGVIDGKEVDISDTQRYKLCGNGVVVNCVDYIYRLLTVKD